MNDIQNRLNQIDNRSIPRLFMYVGLVLLALSLFEFYQSFVGYHFDMRGVVETTEITCEKPGIKCRTLLHFKSGEHLALPGDLRHSEGKVFKKHRWSGSYYLDGVEYDYAISYSSPILIFLVSILFCKKWLNYKKKPE